MYLYRAIATGTDLIITYTCAAYKSVGSIPTKVPNSCLNPSEFRRGYVRREAECLNIGEGNSGLLISAECFKQSVTV